MGATGIDLETDDLRDDILSGIEQARNEDLAEHLYFDSA